MITRPEGYEEAQAFTGEFEPLPSSGQVCRIMDAVEVKTKKGDPMLELSLDIAEGEFSDFFAKLYRSSTREIKKWGCVYRQMLTSDSAAYLKGLIDDIEKSNSFKWNWEETTLKGKLIGMLFQRREYEKRDGTLGWFTEPISPRSVQAIRDGNFTVPKDKPLYQENTNPYTPPEGFVPAPDDDDLPF
jgi:hypothetical protein